jgi:hypothetical protein
MAVLNVVLFLMYLNSSRLFHSNGNEYKGDFLKSSVYTRIWQRKVIGIAQRPVTLVYVILSPNTIEGGGCIVIFD